MKKKQKQKLLNQFRPSLDGVRGQLFRSLEEESLRRYGLPLQVMLDPKNRQILTIGLAGKTNEDTRINVPIDDNFNTVLKRIRSGENGIFERFRDNLLIEIVSYWNDQRLKTMNQLRKLLRHQLQKKQSVCQKKKRKNQKRTQLKIHAQLIRMPL